MCNGVVEVVCGDRYGHKDTVLDCNDLLWQALEYISRIASEIDHNILQSVLRDDNETNNTNLVQRILVMPVRPARATRQNDV